MAIPEIRSFQFGNEAVNLFRGDVDLPLTLFSLSGRNGLEVCLSLLYTSNIHTQLETWNVEAPTSIVGFGWQLPRERIEVDVQNTASAVDNLYYYVANENKLPLLSSNLKWYLFQTSIEYIPYLEQKEIPPSLQEQFAQNSLLLSSASTVRKGLDDLSWQIFDPVYERIFTIYQENAQLKIIDGGKQYELQNYQFWKISYYPEYERWLIINENGMQFTYGSKVKEQAGLKKGRGNSIEWGVRWGNWLGSSVLLENQEQYPLAWNLSEVASLWGDSVYYTYDTVEQHVGEQGLSYTKACYLSSITDVFKRKVVFHYQEKYFDNSTADGPREYLDPHKPLPNNTPNAYQDRYATRFLDKIDIKNEADDLLQFFQFHYKIFNATGISPQDTLYGDTCKRYLTGIQQFTAEGNSLPGLVFDYYIDSCDIHPGALKTVTSPLGGSTTYMYEKEGIPLANRSFQINRPKDEPTDMWVPKVWFGVDYAVVAWYNMDSYILRISAYTWIGTWYEGQESKIDVKIKLEIETLNVMAGSDFFSVTYRESSQDRTGLYLFHKQIHALGRWSCTPLYTIPTYRPQLAAGNKFILALDPDQFTLYRYTWQWQDKTWAEDILPLQSFSFIPSTQCRFYLGAQHNLFVLLAYDIVNEKKINTLNLIYLDDQDKWTSVDPLPVNDIFIASAKEQGNFFWSLASSFAAATYITKNSTDYVQYDLQIFGWDKNYQLYSSYTKEELKLDKPVQFVPAVINNSLIGSGPYLFRYNGKEWQSKEIELTVPVKASNVFWFAYGEDFAVVTENAVNQIVSLFSAYDPNQDSLVWQTDVTKLINVAAPSFRQTRYFPTASQDIFTLDKSIYSRGLHSSWDIRSKQPIHTIPDDEAVDTTTFVNGAPGFLTYLEYEGDYEPKQTHVLNIKNGRVRAAMSTPNQLFQIYNEQGYVKPNLNGKYPAGPYSLYTFPTTNTLNDTPYITLHRYLTNEIAGEIIDYRVRAIETNDGFKTRYTCYQYDAQTAIPDPTGTVIKYYRVCTYAGCELPAQAKEGYAETIYINGLPSTIEGINHAQLSAYNNTQDNYSILDGFIDKQNTYDHQGKLITSQKNDWFVQTEVVSFLDNQPHPIQGYYALLKQVSSDFEGVLTTAQTSYDFASGQIIQRDTTNYNARGYLEKWTENSCYAYQQYPTLQHLNILPVVIQVKTQVQEGEQVAISKLYATRLKAWQTRVYPDTLFPLILYAVYDNFQWRGGEGHPHFTAWEASAEPGLQWRRGSTITARSSNGLVLETEDIMKRVTSTLYDRDYKYPVATFSNAKLLEDEADYLGFEEYEVGSKWTVAPSNTMWRAYVSNDTSNTGRCTFKLSAAATGQNSLQRTFQVAQKKPIYLLTSWYKTTQGFIKNAEQARWLITIFKEDQEVSKTSYPFEPTLNEWKYVSYPINLEAYQDSNSLKIMIEVVNTTNPDVYIDYIRFSPLLSSFSANVYDTQYDLQLATIGPNQEIQRSVYNDFKQATIDVGPDENVNGFSLQYYSRQCSALFDPLKPNASIDVVGMEKGFYSDFQRDGGYQKHWSTVNPAAWTITQGRLQYQGEEESTIMLNSPELTEHCAAYLLIDPQESVTQPIGLRIGQALTLQWNPLQNTWVIKLLASHAQYTVNTAKLAKEWVIYFNDRVLLFFADGEKLFALVTEQSIKGQLQLFTSNKVAFYNIAICAQPQLTINYVDGWEKEQQSQMLFDQGSVTNATVYDDLNRAAVQTKTAHLKPTQTLPLLTYRPNFVASIDWQSGVMQGEISDYYSANGEGYSNDEGYPYTRTLYEQSPLARPIETGLAGKDFAINLNIDSAARRTSKIRYTINQESDPIKLPKNQYFVTTTIDADGNTAFSFSDQNKNLIGSAIVIDQANSHYNMTTYQAEYNNLGKKVTTFLPNYYDPTQKAYQMQWQATTHYDMLEQATQSISPNVGMVEIIYDLEGKVRFTQDAQGRTDGYYLYIKYDIVGRVIEDGQIKNGWDSSQLQHYADTNPAWPVENTTWARKMTYDGSGSEPNLLSRLVLVAAREEDTADVATIERFAYDIQGNIIQHTLELCKQGRTFTTQYNYNNQGKVTLVIYPHVPQRADPLEVHYFYSEGGLMQSVGTKEQPDYYASYTYYADGSLYKENIHTVNIERLYSYLPPGWLAGISDPYYQQKMYYTQDSQGKSGYFTGLVAEEAFAFTGNFPQSLTQMYAYRYEYNRLGQLVKAENRQGATVNPQWSIGLEGKTTHYDDNGNILEFTEGGNTKVYKYITGTDKVKNTQGNTDEVYHYDQNGNIITATPKAITKISYDKITQRTTSIETESDTLHFIYDNNSRRIAKLSSQGAKFYFYGLSATPLTEMMAQGEGETSTHYIHGATGLLGFDSGDHFYTLLRDRLGSSRVLLEDTTILAGYTYLPFGAFMDIPEKFAVLAYYYTGQELDEEIALYNYKARFYDPSLGRFYAPDAAGQFASPYIYGANNPIMFIDPSGNISIGAIAGIVGGAVAIAAGIGVTVATMGAGTPVGLGLGILGAGLIGAGVSSVTYSAINRDNWKAGDWGINVGIGAVSGAVSAGIGMGVGAAALNVSIRVTATLGGKAAAAVGAASLAAGGMAEGAVTNVVTTAVSNAIFGEKQGLGTAAWQGAAVGGITGGIGGLRGARIKARSRSFKFAAGADTIVNTLPTPHDAAAAKVSGLTGLLDTQTQRLHLGTYTTPDIPDVTYGSAHLQMALKRAPPYGPTAARRFADGDTRASYPNLRGFAIQKRTDGKVRVGFSSASLNSERDGVIANRMMGAYNRSLLQAVRYQLNIRPYLYHVGDNPEAALRVEIAFARFLRSPFS
jgi:RHS repeat-associated protein